MTLKHLITRNLFQNIFRSYSEHSINVKPAWVPFYKAKYGNFVQEPPVLENQFTSNAFIQSYLQREILSELYYEIEPDLVNFGGRVAKDINELAIECENNKPYLKSNAAWGGATNELVVCDAWNKQKDISAQEGLIAIGYNRRKYHKWARLYQFAKLYLYAPSSGLYSCPLAMTDGAAKTLEELGLLSNRIFRNAYDRLTSRDPQEFWTSGQWMTEKGGGSDVANGTETVAIPVDQHTHKLYGYKWFSSATDANIALTLARIADDEGNVLQGTRGLTLFYVPVKENNAPIVENIHLIRLKDKLGTRQLPTAELLLDDAFGIKICEEGRGIASIAHMLQITRIQNAVSCSSYLQRAFSLARDYAQRRKAFGKTLINLPLHVQALARIDLISKATFLLAFENVKLLGLIECDEASDEEKLLFRILNPLAKLYNSKVAIPAISESIECIGGQGIMEDTGIPYLYRDSQIFAIWEGTTSVLSLDLVRSIIKSNGETLKAYRSMVKKRLEATLNHNTLGSTASKVDATLDAVISLVQKHPQVLEYGARDFAITLSNIFIATLFLENSILTKNPNYDVLPIQFCNTQDLAPFLTHFKLDEYSSQANQMSQSLVMENYHK